MALPIAVKSTSSLNGFVSRLAMPSEFTRPPLPGLPVIAVELALVGLLGVLVLAVMVWRGGLPWAGCLSLAIAFGVVAAPKNSLWNYAPLLLSFFFCWPLVRRRPVAMTVLLAGLALVSNELLEAARVDGATAWQRFTNVMLPVMKPAILVAVLFRVMDAFRIFDNIFILTQGSNSTQSVSILGYDQLFVGLNLGIGSAMSVLIFLNIAARIPHEGANIWSTSGPLVFALICVFGLVIIASVIFVEQGQRRIPVQYAKRMIGRRMYGGTSTYLPIKVNQAGVIPVIFASSLLYLPDLISRLIGDPNSNSGWQVFLKNYVVNQSSWAHVLLYFALIIFFTYFYITITFNVDERAEEMKKFGGFIPGIRPGRPTAEYLSYVLGRITLPGSIYLGIIAILPNFFLSVTGGGNNQNFPFGGTAVLIMVGVGLDTVKQIESQLMQRNYEGFLK